MTNGAATISVLSAEDLGRRTAELSALLVACVHDGASIGFVLPFGEEDARAFWTKKVLPGVRDGTRVLLATTGNPTAASRVAARLRCCRRRLYLPPRGAVRVSDRRR